MEDQDPLKPLRDMGVPDAVIAYLQAQNPSHGMYMAYTTITIVVVFGGFLLGFVVWAPLEALAVQNAIAHARAVGGLMYYVNFGFAGVLALFAWIFAGGAIANLTIRGERRRATYFVFTIANSPVWLRPLTKGSLKRIATPSDDPKAYVDRWIDRGNRQLIVAAIIGLALSGYAFTRDVQAHTLYTASDYIRAPFFPWASTEPKPWRTAERVELGCNHVTGKNAEDYLVYRVRFAGGETVGLENAMPLPNVDWLETAEGIDGQIREAGATFERWNWRDRDPLHPACLAVMRNSFGSDYPRIERLLRIGELPDR